MMQDGAKSMELVPAEDARVRRRYLIARLGEAIPLLKERGVEKVIVYGSILDPERFQEISDIDLALAGGGFSYRDKLRIISLLEEIFGEDGFDVVFLTGDELTPRKAILESILREGVDAEQLIEGSTGSDRRRADSTG